MSEVIAVGTKCPLCNGEFYVPEPKYSKMIQQLVRVARAAEAWREIVGPLVRGTKEGTELRIALKEVEHLLEHDNFLSEPE